MRIFLQLILLCAVYLCPFPAQGGDTGESAAAPAEAKGYPSRAPDFDVLPGFRAPPPGYGEVPFWWWSGDTLNADRMIEQLEKLHEKGISGVQVNYSHFDTPGWLTDESSPGIFTAAWWRIYTKISEACSRFDMGIGLSTYTLDWPRGAHNLFYRLFYSKPELNAIQLQTGTRRRAQEGETKTIPLTANDFAVRAYQVQDGVLQPGGINLASKKKEDTVTWTAPRGSWEVWTFRAARVPGSLNSLMKDAGKTVIRGFFQPFEEHNHQSAAGLDYFFNDELHIGVGTFAWNPDFPAEFQKRKGYDLLTVLPAMWIDMGDITEKVRMDYADVRMSLMEERYFKPVYTWHASRGMIFACDSGGRGRNPQEFGNYFRATRWYTAPGHDTPGGRADLIKGKVSSSIANLYRRPRVWLEGYHSLGWGATPENLMFATRENYLYGCTLLNLHGLYYTTYGSHWEWAPPCYHFRMPYWEHFGQFLDYFERLSLLMSQGHFICDVAVIYPVAPYEARMDGNKAKNTAFAAGADLMRSGINFEFIDYDSLARADVENGKLHVREAGAVYRVLVVPDMEAMRWRSIEKAAAFTDGGGIVLLIGGCPTASDRAGRNDPRLAALNKRAFPSQYRVKSSRVAVETIREAFVQDVRGLDRTVRAHHRRIGFRDVYFVMDAAPGTVVAFRCLGAVELWDPWTGSTHPIRVVKTTAACTHVKLPLQPYEAQIVVFTPEREHKNPPAPDRRPLLEKTLPETWAVEFIPTMNNSWGDFRMPVTSRNRVIGLEARRFAWHRETDGLKKTAMLPETDDSSWQAKLYGCGTQFYVLGPVPGTITSERLERLEEMLKKKTHVDPAERIEAGGAMLSWRPYDFSWRYGKEGDPGHQGYHGLKGTITDDFLCLGRQTRGLNETRYTDEQKGARYYLWTAVTVPEKTEAEMVASAKPPADHTHTSPVLTPAAVYVNGKRIKEHSETISLPSGSSPLLVRYDHAGRGHFVIRRAKASKPEKQTPLAMEWYNDPGVIPFDVHGGNRRAEWFRFRTAPGTRAIDVEAEGTVQAWLDGVAMTGKGNGRFEAQTSAKEEAVIALRVEPPAGRTGGAVLPLPVVVETDGSGSLSLGDWSHYGILMNYSGGVRYSTEVTLADDQARGEVTLDLGRVVATCEVEVNGKKAGVKVAPPWRVDVTGLLKAGKNTLSVLVYNTLSNHYQTVPSRYRGSPASGLFGPVRLLSKDWETGSPAESSKHDEGPVLTIDRKRTTDTGVTITASSGRSTAFDRTITLKDNLLRSEELIRSITGTRTHAGDGSDLSALFNATSGNGQGSDATANDGRTFIGMAEGNTLEIVFDTKFARDGVTIEAIRTYAGHHDARASQNYSVFVSTREQPGRFIRLVDVNVKSTGGLNEVVLRKEKKEPLIKAAAALRLVFKNGPLGFNVYREIAVFGTVEKAPE